MVRDVMCLREKVPMIRTLFAFFAFFAPQPLREETSMGDSFSREGVVCDG